MIFECNPDDLCARRRQLDVQLKIDSTFKVLSIYTRLRLLVLCHSDQFAVSLSFMSTRDAYTPFAPLLQHTAEHCHPEVDTMFRAGTAQSPTICNTLEFYHSILLRSFTILSSAWTSEWSEAETGGMKVGDEQTGRNVTIILTDANGQ